MKQSDWRYLVDALLFICLVGMAFIGILLGLVIPEGPVSSGGSKYFLGIHRHQWGDIHAYLSIAFVVLMVVHLILSWKWITAKTRQIFKRSVTPALVVTACAPFVVLFLFWVGTPKDSDKYREYGVESSGKRYVQRHVVEELTPAAGEPAGTREAPREEEFQANSADESDVTEEEDYRTVGSLVITGRITLLEIERRTGISGRTIADKLGLPPTVSLNEPLGRLKQRYGFEIQAVRYIVDGMVKE
jgi:hypothetical protein